MFFSNLATAWNSISNSISNSSSETSISNRICQYLMNQNIAAAREVPYFANYHSDPSYCLCQHGFNNLIKKTPHKHSHSLACHIDFSLFGKENWLIEAKKQPCNDFPWDHCINPGTYNINSNVIPTYPAIIKGSAKIFQCPIYSHGGVDYFTDTNEGKIWVDILRLIEVRRRFKHPRPRLFLLFYIDNNNITNILKNLPNIFILFGKIGFLISQSKTLDVWSVGKEKFEFRSYVYNKNGQTVLTFTNACNTINAYQNGGNYSSVLIEIVERSKL